MSRELVIYGSYGYTGNLIAAEAVDRGLEPVLAGRDRDRVEEQAITLGCDHEVVGLDDPQELDWLLEEATAVLHCAGPFESTYRPMVESCLRTGTHYLDITGEIDVFEGIHAEHDRAEEAGVMLLPGVGFDVVPTDCTAAHLAERLPDADRLELAFHAEVGVSPGTAKTAVGNLDEGGRVRRNGHLERVPIAHESRTVDFGWGHDDLHAAAIPWGDVSTAYYTTGIGDVTVYQSMHPKSARNLRLAGRLGPLLGVGPVQSALAWLIVRFVVGPDAEELASEDAYVWGEARTHDGERAVTRLRCPHTYATTVETALAVVDRVLFDDAPVGFQTPAGAYGPDLILDVEGAEREDVV
jgi:short subunit dehydrogenase-like uncharacterized protein